MPTLILISAICKQCRQKEKAPRINSKGLIFVLYVFIPKTHLRLLESHIGHDFSLLKQYTQTQNQKTLKLLLFFIKNLQKSIIFWEPCFSNK